jgi:sensor histidine kinase YesM
MLPFVMLATYVTIYLILPHYLKKRNLLFTLYAVISVLFVTTLGERIFLRKFNSLEITFDTMFTLSYVYILLETNFMVASAVAIKIAKKWIEQQNEKHEIEKRNLETELNLLKAQLHPHFLFNTMNNLYALSMEKSAKTSEGIAKISNLLRSVLYECNDAEITLEKEIQLIENYIDLERMRYGDRLKLKFEITGNIYDKKIAPMLLFTFIEILLSVSSNEIHFFARNSKPIKKKQSKNVKDGGIGLNNVKKRLEIIYKDNYELQIRDLEHTFEVDLIMTK